MAGAAAIVQRRILIASQAPGTKVHLSGMPFTDASGDRLRSWLEVTSDEFYDIEKFAIVPMGFRQSRIWRKSRPT